MSGGVAADAAARTSAGELLARSVPELAAAGCETPRLDGEVLLAGVLGISRERLLADPRLRVDEARASAFEDAVRRRGKAREPVAYITRTRHFRHLELCVDPRVLIPRPETELLVEAGLALAPGASVLDVGTGSGAVALAVKDERPDLRVAGSDISPAAVAVARANAARLGLDVRFLDADLLLGVADEFDAVLCNPPYVAEGDRRSLSPEILRHEPAQALFAGPDGLDVIRRLADQLAPRVRVRSVALEIGAGQASEVRRLLVGAGFSSVRTERDLAGIERVLVATRA
jgi:release factor glutamine methyltransferase